MSNSVLSSHILSVYDRRGSRYALLSAGQARLYRSRFCQIIVISQSARPPTYRREPIASDREHQKSTRKAHKKSTSSHTHAPGMAPNNSRLASRFVNNPTGLTALGHQRAQEKYTNSQTHAPEIAPEKQKSTDSSNIAPEKHH